MDTDYTPSEVDVLALADNGERRKLAFKLGDLNIIDLRFSLEELRNAEVPAFLIENPELLSLWCGHEVDDDVERFFNKAIGSQSPYCAICALLWAPQSLGKILSSTYSDSSPDVCDSEPHITEVAYLPHIDGTDIWLPVASERRSYILSCSNCHLTVHARCYGVSETLAAQMRDKHNYSDTMLRDNNFPCTWVCDACSVDKKPTCILCYMRGGAMKPLENPINHFTQRPYWAHIVCALASPGCRFMDVASRAAAVSTHAINRAIGIRSRLQGNVAQTNSRVRGGRRFLPTRPRLSASLSVRRKLQPSKQAGIWEQAGPSGIKPESTAPTGDEILCSDTDELDRLIHSTDSQALSCSKTGKHKLSRGAFPARYICAVCSLPSRGFLPLARCWHALCPNRYHVTCAQMAGVKIGIDIYPRLFHIACDAHPTSHRQTPRELESDIVKPGDEIVIRRSSNPPKFIPAVVTRLVSPLYCRVAFPDGTFSNDTSPEYLVGIDWNEDGPPRKGSTVTVLWNDDTEYPGTFQGTTPEIWEVQLNDGTVETLSREQFYLRPGRQIKSDIKEDAVDTVDTDEHKACKLEDLLLSTT